MDGRQSGSIVPTAQSLLASLWAPTLESSRVSEVDELPIPILEAIERCINSATKSYRYVLPTQLLALAIDPTLDCRAIQEGSRLPGAFDARSLCHRVIVPFDRVNLNVLGGSTEPYVNNPLRIPAILPKHAKAQKNKAGFRDLCAVLGYAQEHKSEALALLQAVLAAIARRSTSTHIVYPVPNRVSIDQTFQLLQTYLESRTGGVRLQAVAVALFRCVGHRLRLFSSVRSANVNAADASTGQIADIECLQESGEIALAVEVKDRQLTLRHVEDKLPMVRERGIRELLFLFKGGIAPDDQRNIRAVIDQQFVTGQNIYTCEFDGFLHVCLILFGESGRRELLQAVGEAMDAAKADLSHRIVWRDLLQRI